MKKEKVILSLDADEIIAQIKEKYGETPIFTEKAKKLQEELRENPKLAAQIASLKKDKK
ncbi:MAG: hypothetical protein NW226_24300 [Microscillaceae bacterium]|nr:hypothetical protein [Microscillaceae bacterium]